MSGALFKSIETTLLRDTMTDPEDRMIDVAKDTVTGIVVTIRRPETETKEVLHVNIPVRIIVRILEGTTTSEDHIPHKGTIQGILIITDQMTEDLLKDTLHQETTTTGITITVDRMIQQTTLLVVPTIVVKEDNGIVTSLRHGTIIVRMTHVTTTEARRHVETLQEDREVGHLQLAEMGHQVLIWKPRFGICREVTRTIMNQEIDRRVHVDPIANHRALADIRISRDQLQDQVPHTTDIEAGVHKEEIEEIEETGETIGEVQQDLNVKIFHVTKIRTVLFHKDQDLQF